jgi:origin recognition complex subunit 1
MPHQKAPLTPRQKRANKAERARKLLAGSTLRRDDSEDEDQPWEWIYEKENSNKEGGEESADEDGGDRVTPKKRKRSTVLRPQEKRIVAATMGCIKYKIGDSVLLKPPDGGAPWVGIILKFLEDDEGEMSANILCRSPQRSSKGYSLI